MKLYSLSVLLSQSERSSFRGISVSSCHWARISMSVGSPVKDARLLPDEALLCEQYCVNRCEQCVLGIRPWDLGFLQLSWNLRVLLSRMHVCFPRRPYCVKHAV